MLFLSSDNFVSFFESRDGDSITIVGRSAIREDPEEGVVILLADRVELVVMTTGDDTVRTEKSLGQTLI